MSSGRTASEDFAFVEPEPKLELEPSNGIGPLSSAGSRNSKRGKGEEEGKGASSICACYCHLCVLFLFSFAVSHSAFFPAKFACKTIDTQGRCRGLGQGSQPFWPFQLPLKLFSRVRQMHPGGRFHFVICVFDILLKCC